MQQCAQTISHSMQMKWVKCERENLTLQSLTQAVIEISYNTNVCNMRNKDGIEA